MKKIILWIAIIFFAFWIISPMLLESFDLEFKERSVERAYEEFRFWGILICIVLTLFWTIKKTDKLGRIALKVMGTIGITVLIFFFMAMSVLSDMCDWSHREVLFTNKTNKKIKIIKREYGCGAVDSEQPIVKDFEVKEVGKFFITSREINIEEIVQNEWVKNE